MVDLISKVSSQEVKGRDGKQNSTRSAGNSQTKPLGREDQHSSAVIGAESVLSLSIASANMEAARVTLEDQETADRVLQFTSDLIRQNPEQAELAQANIPSQIVLSLFQTR